MEKITLELSWSDADKIAHILDHCRVQSGTDVALPSCLKTEDICGILGSFTREIFRQTCPIKNRIMRNGVVAGSTHVLSK